MLSIILPDGSKKEIEKNTSATQVAEMISKSLMKSAVAVKVDGELKDMSYEFTNDSAVEFVTAATEDGVDVIRHSAAHLLAQAVQRLYPKVQVTIGPVIENGFYYDFATDITFNDEDLKKIEKEMQKIVSQNLMVERFLLSRDEAVMLFKEKGEHYKVEIIESIPSNENLSFYKQGEFVDLCRGPHVPSTSHIKAFKLTKVAGAYWRGDSNNQMLQRIYGTAWATKADLDAYLKRLEEAEKRDHRKLATKLDLFHIQSNAPGMVFWHPNGWTIYQQLEKYIREKLRWHGYQEIKTPLILDRSLWEKSGHWETFRENMFSLSVDEKDYAVKPMNCPCHIQIFNQGLKSYKDLPIRMSEFGSCHRYEPSGALHGLMRLRNFVQDDAHIFCREDQIQAEVCSFIDLLFDVYKDFGFEHIEIKLSLRPDKRVGSDEVWDKAEGALSDALKQKGLDFALLPKEGAFYGPKIEFTLKDCIGRVWQCGTIQVDFSMPERLGASYIGEDSKRHTPIMLHRAILGSLERFIGILIEDTEGKLPFWLAPVQVVVMNITDNQKEYAQKLVNQLMKSGIRVASDFRNEKIGFKIREQTIQKVPYLAIIGDKEVLENKVAIRSRDGDDLGVVEINRFIDFVNRANTIKTRALLKEIN